MCLMGYKAKINIGEIVKNANKIITGMKYGISLAIGMLGSYILYALTTHAQWNVMGVARVRCYDITSSNEHEFRVRFRLNKTNLYTPTIRPKALSRPQRLDLRGTASTLW